MEMKHAVKQVSHPTKRKMDYDGLAYSSAKWERIHGLVRFPVEDPKWQNTREGGMFVRLVVVPPKGLDYPICSGGLQHIFYDKDPDESTKRQFPNRENVEMDPSWRYLSIGYIAVLYLGSTGWSGADANGDYWQCQRKDLTLDGRNLMDLMMVLHPKCRVELQTWLDT
jgi:hypothetical protein